MREGLLEKIKSRGYWRINFEPLADTQKLDTLAECRDLVQRCSVQFRGWDYPHYPLRTGDDAGLDFGSNFCEGWIDWWSMIEFWRMYQSGQFLHYFALNEDWHELDRWSEVIGQQSQAAIEPPRTVNLIGSIVYQLTEIFQYLSRMAAAGVYDEGARVRISLHNVRGRKLLVNDPRRAPLFYEYKAAIDVIEYANRLSTEEMLTRPKECALQAILHILERFGWTNPPVDAIQQDQANLIQRQFA